MFGLPGKLMQYWTEMWTPSGTKRVEITEVAKGTALDMSAPPYKSVAQIKAECNADKKPIGFSKPAAKATPFFYLSKNKSFRKRVGRIIYGKEGNDIFL